MILELINRRSFHEGFPIVLFGLLWLLPVAFILILMPIVRNVRAGNRIMVNPISLLLRVAFLILIAWLWGGIILDQMPCFLGVPNCD
jgi:ABC-type amino acid transport system permease subunit